MYAYNALIVQTIIYTIDYVYTGCFTLMILLKMSNVYLPVSSVKTSLVPSTCNSRWPLLVMPPTRATWPVAARVT